MVADDREYEEIRRTTGVDPLKSIDEALSIRNTDIVKELALPPVKIHCSVLAEDAIKSAIEDYRNKQNKDGDSPEEAEKVEAGAKES